jgi:DNA polymerase-1
MLKAIPLYEPNPEAFLRIVRDAKLFAYDVETTGLDWKRNSVIGYSVSNGSASFYVPVRHTGGGNICNATDFEQALSRTLGGAIGTVIGHNLKFDVLFSLNHGVDLRPLNLVCTMVTQALIDEHTSRFSLGALAKSYGVTPKIEQELYNYISLMRGCKPDRKAMGHYHEMPGNDPMVAEYAAGDTKSTYELHIEQLKRVDEQSLGIVYALENRLTRVLVDMEVRGISVDRPRVKEILEHVTSYIVHQRMDKLLCDFELNTRSSRDMASYFKMYDIEDWPLTDKGNPSFTSSYLETTELGQKLISIKNHETFLNTFLKPFVQHHVFKPGDGTAAVHTSFNQVKTDDFGTVTGRLSSNNPNMQQVPKRNKEIGRLFRSMFVARPGYLLAEMDYSQCEPRLYAHYSNEARLVDGYRASPFIDMHSIVSAMLGVDRDHAKVLNLAILYLMGQSKLARALGISEEEAQRLWFGWYKLFPSVSSWRKRAIAVAEDRGYVRTILGRRRRFPDTRGAYKAPNAIIQGGSADILKFKMCEIGEYVRSSPVDLHMLLNIHDSIVFEVEDTPEGVAAISECKRIMEDVNGPPFSLTVPFVADLKMGKDWAEATYGK